MTLFWTWQGDGHFNIDGLMDVMVRSYKSLEEEKEAILSAFRVFDKQVHPLSLSTRRCRV